MLNEKQPTPQSPTHTPTPWVQIGYEIKSYPDNKFIAEVPQSHGEDYCKIAEKLIKESLANAAFIVRAVNTHDALIKRLYSARELLQGINESTGNPKLKEETEWEITEIDKCLKS